MKKRLLSIITVMALCLNLLPAAALAAESDGLCEHHTEHTAECGYVEGETPCGFVCGQCAGEEPESSEPEENQSEESQPEENQPEENQPVENAATVLTDWEWVDDWEIIDPDSGNVLLPFASEDNVAYFEDIVELLPVSILAGGEELTLGDWLCPDYPEEAAYEGEYLFETSLPDGYTLPEGGSTLTLTVALGDPEGGSEATLYETVTATWTYPTKTPTLTWTGSGTAEDPYIITTAQELANMSYIVNAGLQNSDGKNYYELCYKLGADIDIGGKQWVPIGGIKNGTSYLYTFWGSFDGNNHTISNLTMTELNTNYDANGRGGLFRSVNSNAEIKNVKLENVNISMKGSSGALVSLLSACTISNCHVLSGTITSTSTQYQYFGGLIGSGGSCTITNCTNRATVTGSSTYNDYVGGIIGNLATKEINISNCYNYGSLSSKFYVGGIVGSTKQNGANTTISNCGNEGSINSQYYAGGIVGIVSSPDSTDLGHKFTISGCYNKGTITTPAAYINMSGGIVGRVGNKDYLYLFIERCYNAGTVTSDIYGSHIYDTESENYSTQAVSVKNCVYTGDKVAYFGTGDNDAFNRKLTTEELESGKATVYLNQGLSEENLIWYQNLSDSDKDNYPVTDNTHSKVYASDYCMVAATFSNTAPATKNNSHTLEHVAQVDAKCGISGLKEHYKCNKCGELYSDASGTNIVTSVELVIPPTATEHNHVDGICTVCGDLLTPQQGEDGYYLIYTLGELISYADMVTPDDGAAWIPMDEPTEASQKVRLMADIDMSSVYNAETGKSWNPIGGGDGGAYFKGDFDGNGHTISGLYINSTTVQYAGLFGRLMFGVCCVHDLTLKEVSINAPNATAAGAVAGFVDSYKKSPTIKNCMVESGTIIGKESVGGIAGKTSSGQLLSATEEGNPILIDSGYISVIQNCGNKATVTATTNAGGLSGSGPVWIDSSYNSGTVTGATSGQITGSLSEKSKVNNCYYLGTSDTAFGVNSTDAQNITNVAYKSAEEFASGEVCYLLNNQITDNSQAWYQNLDVGTRDDMPKITGGTVYKTSESSPCQGYTNNASGIKQHNIENGTCTWCNMTGTAVTVSGTIKANDKIYDGNATATLSFEEVTLTGVSNNDDVSVTATGTFGDKNVGENKTVTITDLTLTGSDASKYYLTDSGQQTTTTATITKKPVTAVVTVADKTYNGDSIATVNAEVTEGVEGDDSITINGLTGTFENVNAGTSKTVTVNATGMTITGTGSGNYTVNIPTTATGTINKAQAVITVADSNKEYSKTYGDEPFALEGITENSNDADVQCAVKTGGDVVSLSGTTVTLLKSGEATITLSLPESANYLAAQSVDISIHVAQKSNTVTITGNPSKIYDGAPATLTADGYTATGDGSVTVEYKVTGAEDCTYSSDAPKDAGEYTVRVTQVATANSAGAFATKGFTISPKVLKANDLEYTGSAITKEYNGSHTCDLTSVSIRSGVLVGTDTLTVNGTAIYDSANAGSRTVTFTPNEITTGNYTLAATEKLTIQGASISPKAITVSDITAKSKTYDETTAAELDYTNVKLDGKVGSDDLSVTATGTFTDTYAGTNKAVTISNLTLSGAAKANYVLAMSGQQTSTTASINPAAQTPTIIPTSSLSRGGSILDLRTLVSGNQGDVTFEIASGTAATLGTDKYTLTSDASATGDVVLTVQIVAKDVNNDGFPEYNTYTGASAITVTVTTKTTAALPNGVTQTDCTYGETLAAPSYSEPTGTTSTTIIYKGTLRKDNSAYNSTTKPTEAGTYTVTVQCETVTHIYTATSDTFTISPKSIEGAVVTLGTALTYNGSNQTQNVTKVELGGTDITGACEFSGNVQTNAGDYTLAVTAKDASNYTGSVTQDFTIAKKSIAPTIEVSGTYIYTGSAITPTFTVKDSNTDLAASDYTAVVADNINAGSGKITVTAKAVGNFTFDAKQQSFTIGKAAARMLADISASQKYTVTTQQSKDIGRAGMPADTGTLTYAKGSASTTGSAAVTDWYVDSTGKVTFTLSGGAVNDTVTLPIKITSTNYADSTVNVVITLTDKDTPTVNANDITVTYTGSAVPNSTITGTASVDGTWKFKTSAPVDVADSSDSVTVVFTPTDTANYETVEDTIKVTINKATPTGRPAYTAITTSGKTLADAALAVGTITPTGGSIVWDLGDSQTVSANTAYNWTYTPADTANYNKLTGNITPYVVSYSGGGSSGSSNTTTKTEKNPDGSTTTTVTDKTTGTVTETTKNTDGSTTVVETKKDGTVTETNKSADGTSGTVVTDKNGTVTEVKSSVSSTAAKEAAKTGEAVTLPVEVPAVKTTGDAPSVDVTVPQSAGSVKVEIPVEQVTPGTVAVIVNADGTEEIVKTSIPTENGVVLTLAGSATVKIVDNAKAFVDIHPVNHWAEDAVDFASARGITGGTSDTTFSPNASCTRAQIVTFLWRAAGSPEPENLSDFSDVSADAYYAKAVAWALENGITGGTGNGMFSPDATCTRSQSVTFLYRAAGSPTASDDIAFGDVTAESYYADAVAWAAQNGITSGIGSGLFGPANECSRAQIVTFLYRWLVN